MNLVRLLLLEIETNDSPHGIDTENVNIEGFTTEEIYHHAKVLDDAGFIAVAFDSSTMHGPSLFIERLTWSGHEFLDAARESTRWKQAMTIAQNAGGVTIPVLQGVLVQLLNKSLGLS